MFGHGHGGGKGKTKWQHIRYLDPVQYLFSLLDLLVHFFCLAGLGMYIANQDDLCDVYIDQTNTCYLQRNVGDRVDLQVGPIQFYIAVF